MFDVGLFYVSKIDVAHLTGAAKWIKECKRKKTEKKDRIRLIGV